MLPRLIAFLKPYMALACLLLVWLPSTAFSELGPMRRPPMASAAEDPNGARVIVKYKSLGTLMRAQRAVITHSRGPQFATTLGLRAGMTLRDGRTIDGRSQVVWGDKSMSSAKLAKRLAADADVEYAVPDLRRYAMAVPNDPLYVANVNHSPEAGQWYLRPPDTTFVSAINAVGAWNVTSGSASVVVADLDTGVLFNHPDLAGKLYSGYDFVSDVSTSGDGDGRDADATDPGSWTTYGECGSGQAAENSDWHGTQTAALIGAQTNNGIGMASVGYNVMVLPVRVLGKCGGTDSDIIAAMLWAGGLTGNPVVNAHPARVINLSLGAASSCSQAYVDAISQLNAAGVVVVVAAGNYEGLAVTSPGNCSGVMAVAGLRHTGSKVGFSSIGPEVAISAPAGNCVNTSAPCLYPILTATNAGTTTATVNTYSDSTNYSVGTSFATPLVSGTAALMLSANPALTPAQVKSLIQGHARAFPTSSADPSVPQCHAPNGVVQDECLCTTSTCGAGMLDTAAAVTAAAATAQPTAGIVTSATAVVTGDTVTFDASSSLAPTGRSISTYQWAITSGSTIAQINGSANAAQVAVSTSGAGSFTVQLTVTDSTGQQGSDTASVTVDAPSGSSAHVQASANTVSAGNSVNFDGSGSIAASGLSITSYQWAIINGHALATFTSATNAATAAVSTTGSGSGTFTVQLTVTDSGGNHASATSTVSVTAVSPIAAISQSTLSVAPGGTVSFDGSGSVAPGGRTLSSYLWHITSGGAIAHIVGSANAATATVVTTAAGAFTMTLDVTDSAGAQDSKSTTVTVMAPVATIAAPSGGGGGGGSVDLLSLLALAVALAATVARRPSAYLPAA